MRIITLTSLPLMKGFYAINLCGIVFSRGKLNEKERRHEFIHTMQQRELLFLPFFLWYVIEWAVLYIKYRNARKAYFNISFEREAYAHEGDAEYPLTRSRWAFIHFLRS